MIDINERLPKEFGDYEVMTNHGKSVAFWTRNMNGKKIWLCINEDSIVTHWKDKI